MAEQIDFEGRAARWQIVQEGMKSGNISETCRRHGIAEGEERCRGGKREGSPHSATGANARASVGCITGRLPKSLVASVWIERNVSSAEDVHFLLGVCDVEDFVKVNPLVHGLLGIVEKHQIVRT